MNRAFSRLLTLSLLAAAAVFAGCERGADRVDEMAEALAAASTRPGLILVHARVDADSGLVIDRAAPAPGAAPQLVDDPDLEGRIELVDEEGQALWSMGYRPLDSTSGGATLTLRAPLLDAAVAVRLTEAGGKRRAEIPIER